MTNTTSKSYYILIFTIFFMVTIFLVTEMFFGIRNFSNGHLVYQDFMLSDWLINYEAGFVRRGLIGQFLFILYNIKPHPIAYTIIVIYMGSFFLLIGVLIHIFKKNGWSLFVTIFPVCLAISFLGVRRDYLILLIYQEYFAGSICVLVDSVQILGLQQ